MKSTVFYGCTSILLAGDDISKTSQFSIGGSDASPRLSTVNFTANKSLNDEQSGQGGFAPAKELKTGSVMDILGKMSDSNTPKGSEQKKDFKFGSPIISNSDKTSFTDSKGLSRTGSVNSTAERSTTSPSSSVSISSAFGSGKNTKGSLRSSGNIFEMCTSFMTLH